MPLSWNEIRHRAITFSKEWKGETREAAERQSFWNDFFNVFGVRRRTVATFEEPVKKLSGDWGFIDLFWPGRLLVEHKSAGSDLGKAHAQGMDYIRGLKDSGRDREIPRWLIVSDFARIALHDLEPEQDPSAPLLNRLQPSIEFPLADFHKCVRHFAFIAGYTHHKLNPEDPANLEATQLMCDLHDALEAGGYTGHELKRFLVRILFCLFAEANGIFPQKAFELFIRDRTAEDGSDLGVRLEQLFHILNTDTPQRQRNLDEELSQFPYVNGDLFAERLDFAEFNANMRNGLLACCGFRWETISPAVFGSLFQAVMDSKERRQIGAHYTAEKNILKLIRPLFLDDLRAEFESIKADRSTRRTARLQEFQDKLAKLRFFDPACGCGNFLVLTYRELRKLELEVLLELHGQQHEMSLDDVNRLSKLNVHQFYGIEIEEFPARIAEVALWLTDHQANVALSQAFGQFYQRLPLRASPHIHVGNALRMDWREVILPAECSYILGNPPFVGGKFQTNEQRADMALVAGNVDNYGLLDYVTGWYFKAANYIQGTRIPVAFVSTNSISQGEQVGVLWNPLFQRFGLKIHFAHRTFPWESEARGKAHVHVVIIGFGAFDTTNKRIYDYDGDNVVVVSAKNIGPYLVEGSDHAITNRSKPLCAVPEIGIGNKPIDGGYYLFTPQEKREFLTVEPGAAKYFRRWFGSAEFVNGIERWCLWLGECPPDELRRLPECKKRVDLVAKYRRGEIPPKGKEATKRNTDRNEQTMLLANKPTRFHVENIPTRPFLVIPETGSDRRHYLPVGFMSPLDGLCSNLVKVMPDATLLHFGVLSSAMHMAWMRQVGGRMKSDPRYSVKLTYNNYPWPEAATDKQRAAVETAAQAVLDARAQYPTSTLADLYDPLTMPAPLLKAHQELDRTVDRCYRPEPFDSDRRRVEYLFTLYEKIAAPLVAAAKPKRGSKRGAKPQKALAGKETETMPKPARRKQTDTRSHIFISHSSKDKPFADKLANDLKAHEIDVWVDDMALKIGDSIVDSISLALVDAAYLIVVLSQASVKSRWVTAEMNYALMEQLSGKGMVVLPVLIQDCEIPALLKDRLYADFREDYAAGLEKLTNLLKLDKSSYTSLYDTVLAFHTNEAGKERPSCPSILSRLSVGDLRHRMTMRLQRPEVATIWFDTLETLMDNDMARFTLAECTFHLIDRARSRNLLNHLIFNICRERSDLADG